MMIIIMLKINNDKNNNINSNKNGSNNSNWNHICTGFLV